MAADRIHPGPIRAVTFDLDDTLWDVEPAIERAERDLRAWLDANCPDMAARYDRDALFKVRAAIVAKTPRLQHDVSELRVQVLKAALIRTGHEAAEAERFARAGFEVFLSSRHAIEYYEHAVQVLRTLRRRYVIGALTNGNADVRRLDIGPLFHFAIQAGEVGASKPEPAMFEEAMRRTRLGPGRDRARRRPPRERRGGGETARLVHRLGQPGGERPARKERTRRTERSPA